MPRRKPRFHVVTYRIFNVLASSPQDAASQAVQILRRSSTLQLDVNWKERGHQREAIIVLPFAGPHTGPQHLHLTEPLLRSMTSNADYDSESWRIWHDDSGNLFLSYKGRCYSSWREPGAAESWKHYRIIVDRLRIVNATRRGKRRYAFEVENLPTNLRSWPQREVAKVVMERFPVRGPMTGDSGPIPRIK